MAKQIWFPTPTYIIGIDGPGVSLENWAGIIEIHHSAEI